MSHTKNGRPERAARNNQAGGREGLATWKFETIKSVMNDPALTPACLPLMIVALDFKAAWDTTPFLPLLTLIGRTGLARATVIKARRLLVDQGYWTQAGKNESGLDVYAISDPKREAIRSLIDDRQTRLREEDKLRKIDQRGRTEIRRPKHNAVSSEIELNGRAKTIPHGRAEIRPNTVDSNSVDINTVDGGGAFQAHAADTSNFDTGYSLERSGNETEGNAPLSRLEAASGASIASDQEERHSCLIRIDDDPEDRIYEADDDAIIECTSSEVEADLARYLNAKLDDGSAKRLVHLYRLGRLTAGTILDAIIATQEDYADEA